MPDEVSSNRDEYSPKRVMEAIRDYGILQKKTKDLSPEEAKNSNDYRTLMALQRYLGSLNLSGIQILELTDFFESSITRELVMHHPFYQGLEKNLEALYTRIESLEQSHSMLKRKLREALEPLSGLMALLKEREED